MKKFFLFLLLLLVIGAGVFFTRGFLLGSKQVGATTHAKSIFPLDSLLSHVSHAVQFKTVSNQGGVAIDSAAFLGLHDYLAIHFPLVHQSLTLEKISTFSLLYTWKGKDAQAPATVLMAHQDVVPIETETLSQWRHDPFSGHIGDTYLWGRGTLDDKSSLITMLVAVEKLLSEGFQPNQTIYLAFGHDEEIGGNNGAKQIAKLLEKRGSTIGMVLDEGGIIAQGVLPNIEKPIALIGIAEKGYASIEMKVTEAGGHSSMPPDESNIGILSKAIQNLQANQFPTKLVGSTQLMFDYLAPEMSFMERAIFANQEVTESLIISKLTEQPPTNAMVRTTIAPTVFRAGNKDNVLPNEATAIVNFRILPGETVEDVINHVKRVVNDDRIILKVLQSNDPSKTSSTTTATYRVLEKTIHEVYPEEILVAPFLLLAGTDSKHFDKLSDSVYRFQPFLLTDEERSQIHGIDEKISIQNLEQLAIFYYQLVKNLSS